MSYQVLARKWRPRTFRELVGQEHVLKALVNALDNNRLHHAYLFTGTRGVGKTTIARILAKCLNCEVGVSAEPCGRCPACVAIDEGRFVDLIEVDAASRTKVEDTRELLENVQYAPTSGRFKVYLIDEVHMLSTHSFNALLKTLEEPPPHVKFLLATTDPQKLPATILSRCLQFNLKNMNPDRIVRHLQHVLAEEQVMFEKPALWLLSRAADGSMRDALSLTDQAISYGSGTLTESDVRNMLGTIDRSAVYDIVAALAEADGAAVLGAVQQLAEHAPDFSLALEEILTLLHRIAVVQTVPEATGDSQGDRDKVDALAGRLAAEDVQLFYQLGLTGRRDLALAPDPRIGFEMALLRMLAFRPAGIPEIPQQSVHNTAARDVQPVGPSAGVPEAPAPAKKPEPDTVESSPQPAETADVCPETPVGTAQSAISTAASAPAKRAPMVADTQGCPPDSAPSVDNVHPQRDGAVPVTLADIDAATWSTLFPELGFGGVTGTIAAHCVLERIESGTVHLVLDETNATLFNDSTSERIADHLSLVLEVPVKVSVKVAAVTAETPAARRARVLSERRQQALETLQNDPNIQSLVADFGGVLDAESVTPV